MRLIRGTRLFSKDFVVAGLQGSRFQLAQTLDLDRECFLQWSCFLLAAIPSSLPWTLSHRQKASWRTGSLQHHRWSSQPLFVAQFDDPGASPVFCPHPESIERRSSTSIQGKRLRGACANEPSSVSPRDSFEASFSRHRFVNSSPVISSHSCFFSVGSSAMILPSSERRGALTYCTTRHRAFGASSGSGSRPCSLQRARVFNQNMVAAGCLPDVAIWNSVLRTFAIASAGPLVSSSRKCFRSVVVERIPTTMAICSCLCPKLASIFTRRRCSSVGTKLRGILAFLRNSVQHT